MPHIDQRKHLTKGFTIVELLIVIVVIAILAAISIVAYNGIQERARASSVSLALNQAAKKLATYQVDNPGQYPADLSTIGVSNSSGVSYQYSVNNSTNPATYCVTATTGGTSYKLNSTSTNPANGGCPGHSQGGVAAITNLVLNPKAADTTATWCARSSASGAQTGSRITGQTTFTPSVTTAYRSTLTAVPSTWWRVCMSGIGASEGQTYTLSSWVRPSVATNTVVIILWRNSSGSTVSESAGTFAAHTANTWQRRSVTATAPVGTVSVQLEAGTNGNGAIGATLDATGMMFEASSTLNNYGDGDSTDWAWSGAQNNSASSGPPQ